LANTSNRYVYINDVLQSSTWSVYSNENIDWTSWSSQWGYNLKCRLAHCFLDFTYRNLSTESNRRLFIDSDGKPADGQADLNPLIYLPMTDAATAGSNSGTGSDFTVNGVLDTAGRAPNQNNCSASVFDGVNDYLARSSGSMTSLVDSKQITLSFNALFTETGRFFVINSPPANVFEFELATNGVLEVGGNSGTGVNNYHSRFPVGIKFNVNYNFQLSIDLENATQVLYVDGVNKTSTASSVILNNNSFGFNSSSLALAENISGVKTAMNIGEFYFDTVYTDLATDNPFWDSDANRPKPVRQVISETGTTPLIALPLRGNDAGNNLGSGGDFTVNSGPYTGARGGSEFWARSADFNGTTGYLNKTTALTGVSDNKILTFAVSFKDVNSASLPATIFKLSDGGGDGIGLDITAGDIQVFGQRADSANVLYMRKSVAAVGGQGLVLNQWHTVLFSCDLASTSKRKWYVDGFAVSNPYVDAYVNANMDWTNTSHVIGAKQWGGNKWDGDIGFLYVSQEYIDFSQESNRNLFVDQLGYPKDLTPAIDAGDIAEPLVYMKFDDTSALGTNSGTGGDFTVNGTVTAGADVDPNA
jgi:hypothetical protein